MVVAHGETAVANQARHLCSGESTRNRETKGEDKQETLLYREQIKRTEMRRQRGDRERGTDIYVGTE